MAMNPSWCISRWERETPRADGEVLLGRVRLEMMQLGPEMSNYITHRLRHLGKRSSLVRS